MTTEDGSVALGDEDVLAPATADPISAADRARMGRWLLEFVQRGNRRTLGGVARVRYRHRRDEQWRAAPHEVIIHNNRPVAYWWAETGLKDTAGYGIKPVSDEVVVDVERLDGEGIVIARSRANLVSDDTYQGRLKLIGLEEWSNS